MMNSFAFNIPFISIFLAMLTAILTPLIPVKKFANSNKAVLPERVTCFVVALIGVLSAILLFELNGDEPISFRFMMGHFPAPWGNELRAGPLEAFLALAFSISMFLSLTGNFDATAYDVPERRRPFFCVLVNLLMASLLALLYTNDLFTAYVFIEINTIASCAIVTVKQGGKSVRAALRYLVLSMAGSGLILISICILYDVTGHLLMEPMHFAIINLIKNNQYMHPLTVALYLMTVGLAVKSALYPFASWLHDAHGSATNASSSILSGLVLKGHIFLIIKIFCRVFGIDIIHLLRMDTQLLIFGLLGMIMGSVHAIGQTEAKEMVAWSSVAQVGYIFLGIGLNSNAGIAAACLHVTIHAMIKPMLFTSVGGLSAAAHHKKGLHDLMGTFYVNRWAGLGFIAGACSMMGIPTFAGFASKLSLTMAAFESRAIIWALAALAASSVLNALYYVPAMVVILTPAKNNTPLSLRDISPDRGDETCLPCKGRWPERPEGCLPPVSLSFKLSMSAFLALNFILGLLFMPILRIIERGVSVL